MMFSCVLSLYRMVSWVRCGIWLYGFPIFAFYLTFTVSSSSTMVSVIEPGAFNMCLFDFILYIPSTIFQLNRDGSSWVEPVLS